MDKRVLRRISQPSLVKISSADGVYLCGLEDMTKGGLALTCQASLASGTKLTIALSTPQSDNIKLSGRIVWSKFKNRSAKRKFSMGVKLDDPPQKYIDYMDRLLRREYAHRGKLSSSDYLEIRVDEIIGFMTSDDSQNVDGFYLRTESPLVRGKQIDVKLCCEGLKPLLFLGEVVTELEKDPNIADKPYCAGIRIVSLAKDCNGHLSEYLKKLRFT